MEEYIIIDVKTELETQLRWERSKNEKLKQALDVAARQVSMNYFDISPYLRSLLVCPALFFHMWPAHILVLGGGKFQSKISTF